MTYNRRFFDSIREGSQRSAAAVVPVLMKQFAPRTVIDVGCGEGWWGAAFRDAGCAVTLMDGLPMLLTAFDGDTSGLWDPVGCDLENEFFFYGGGKKHLEKFGEHKDLALCLEVAEHLSPERAPTFVRDLCRLSDTVVFSAAVPGQGGTGHLNEQWPDYWADLFARHGYMGTGLLRWRLWNDERVQWWYRQNLLVFTRKAHRKLTYDGCPSVIHPGAWAHFGHV